MSTSKGTSMESFDARPPPFMVKTSSEVSSMGGASILGMMLAENERRRRLYKVAQCYVAGA